MLQESGARLLVTEARLAGRFQTAASDVVCMDADRGMLASECVDNPDNDATLDNLAYVMFTSRSTGKPKGVMIPHRAICNHMLWMHGAFPLAADDRVLQRTPCNFDASVWEFYAPLMAGARLVMAPPAGRFNPAGSWTRSPPAASRSFSSSRRCCASCSTNRISSVAEPPPRLLRW
jgi:non-ribosomal peptide synthetase component F